MRRAQADAGSKLVQNLYTNPNFETVGSTVTVRTNLCLDPMGVNQGQTYGSGTTITGNVAITGHPEGITTANRVSYTNASSNPGIYISSSIASGTIYTVSAWVYHETIPAAGTQGLAQSGVGSQPSPPAIVQGVWQRLSWTLTASGTNGVGFRISAQTTSGSYLITGMLLEAANGLGTLFAGNTTAAGDFTYAWSGTANNSTSLQQAIDSVGKTQQYFAASISSSDWAASGTKSVRIIPNGATGESFFSILGGFANLGPLVAGRTYTVLGTLRLTAPLTGSLNANALRIVWRQDSNRVAWVQGANVAGVQQLRLKFTIGAAVANGFVEFFNGALPGGGDVWWDNIMVVEGDYQGDYVDGSKPFSKWDGTANASTSVGYPRQLTDLSGKPLLDYTAAGTYTLDNSFGPQEGRTFYTVFENLTDLSGLGPIAQYGDTALSDVVPNSYVQLRQDPHATPGNLLFLRRTGAQGSQLYGIANTRYVVCWGINNTGVLIMSVNGGALITDPTAVVMSLPHQKLIIQSDDALHKHFRTIMFRGYHNDATQQAMSRYLGNKYGANVA